MCEAGTGGPAFCIFIPECRNGDLLGEVRFSIGRGRGGTGYLRNVILHAWRGLVVRRWGPCHGRHGGRGTIWGLACAMGRPRAFVVGPLIRVQHFICSVHTMIRGALGAEPVLCLLA